MGHGILYCTSCQTQLRAPDFDSGAAYRLEGQPYCEKCARELIATLPEDRINEILRAFESTQDDPPERPAPPPERGNRTTRIMKAIAANPGSRILTGTSRRMATVPPKQGNPVPLIVGLGVAVVFLVLLAILGVSNAGRPGDPRPVRRAGLNSSP